MSRSALRVNQRALAPYLFVAPFFVMFFAFWVGPILASFSYSFVHWNGIQPPVFAGLDNYAHLVRDKGFVRAVQNTVVAGIVYTCLLVTTAVGLALLLDSAIRRLQVVFRTAVFLPVCISLAVVALVFQLIFSKDVGLLDSLLRLAGLRGIGWLTDERVALWSIVLVRLWRATGYYAIIVLAGLQNIPRELMEAAHVDGATDTQVTRHITLPLLKPVIVFVAVVSSIWAFQLFVEPWLLTEGGPLDATLTMVIHLYRNSFQYLELGYGSAISWVLTLIILAFSALTMRASGED